MTPGQHVPLIPWATHIIQWRIQQVATGKPRANPYKSRLSSDWGLKLDPMKLELLVIAGQLYRGEYVLKSCTRVAMRSSTLVGAPALIFGKKQIAQALWPTRLSWTVLLELSSELPFHDLSFHEASELIEFINKHHSEVNRSDDHNCSY
ncbi:MAG: hypothetical protein RL536_610 [Candidatus Parcubacteria bacterium]